MKTPAELRAETMALVKRLAFALPNNGLLPKIEAAIDAEIAAARPQWQPIETAPKDQPILGYRSYSRHDLPEFMAVTWFAPGLTGRPEWLIYDGKYKNAGYGPFFSWMPTHWMPLPAAPEPPQ